MKKILIIVPTGKLGGIEIASYNLIKLLSELGYEIKVVKLIGSNDDILREKNENIVLKEYTGKNKLKKIFRLIKTIRILKKIKENFNPEITISNGDYCNTISALTFSNEKKIGTIHSEKSIEITNQGLFGKFCLFGIQIFYKNFEKIICISEGIKHDLIINFSRVPQEKIKVIYNYHDFEKIIKLSEEELEKNEEIRIFENDVILSVGRITYSKALWHLIKVFSILITKKENLKLVFIGSGNVELENKLKELGKTLGIDGYIYFLGRKANPYKYMKKAKVVAMTSYFEGLPNVIVESLAIKIPVITTDASLGVWEIFSNEKIKTQYFLENGVEFFENGIIVKKFKEEVVKNNNMKNEVTEEEIEYSKYLSEILEEYNCKNINSMNILKKFSYEYIKREYKELIENI